MQHDYGARWADIEGDGELAVITFGSTTGAVREAVARAGRAGRCAAAAVAAPARAAAARSAGRRARRRAPRAGRRAEPRRAAASLPARRVDLPGRPRGLHRPGPLPLRPGELVTAFADWAALHAPARGDRMNDMIAPAPPDRRRLQVGLQADLVPRLRRLHGARLAHQGAGHAAAAAARGRRGLRHRLLFAHPGLHHLLRLPRRARPLAGRRHRPEGRAARPDGAGRRRRRRRLFDRRQPLPARLPAQRRPDLHRDGQPCLRHDQGPGLADHRARLGQQALARRHRHPRLPSAGDRARLGRQLRRPRLLRRSERHRRSASRRRSATRASRSSRSSAPASPSAPSSASGRSMCTRPRCAEPTTRRAPRAAS